MGQLSESTAATSIAAGVSGATAAGLMANLVVNH